MPLLLVETLEHLAQLLVLDDSSLTGQQELLDLELFAPVHDQITLQLVKIERACVGYELVQVVQCGLLTEAIRDRRRGLVRWNLQSALFLILLSRVTIQELLLDVA